jgi:hypothetical protein
MAVAMLAGVAPAMAADYAPATVPVGDLVLSYDASTWRTEIRDASVAIHAVGADQHDVPVVIDIAPDTGGCTPAAMKERASLFHPDAWAHEARTIARPGFDLHVATVEMGCRNWTGSPIFACTALHGKTYTITADPGGCRETPPRYDDVVFDMLWGLQVP